MKRDALFAGMLMLVACLQGCGGGASGALPGTDALGTPPPLSSSGGDSTSDKAPTITYTGFAVVQDKGTYSAKIVVFFSEDMDPASISDQNLQVVGPTGKQVHGDVIYLGVTGVFTPSERFEANTEYKAIISTGVRSLAGVPMARKKVWKFTTPNPSDLTGVVVSVASSLPAAYEMGVPVNGGVNVTFAQVMDPGSINTSTISVIDPSGSAVPGRVHYVGVTATFTPDVPLAPDTTYRGLVSAKVKSLGGIAMDGDYRWAFTTGTQIVQAPQIVMSAPADGDTGVLRDSSIAVYFNEAMDTQSINTANFSVSDGNGQPVEGSLSYAGNSAVFTPDAALMPNATYTVSVDGVTGADGTAMSGGYQWSFTTGSFSGGAAPTVVFSDPAPNASHVSRTDNINIAFSEALDPTTVTTATITVTDADGHAAAGSVGYAGSVVFFTPASPLTPGTVYTVTVTSGLKDLHGHAFQGPYSWQFVTVYLM